MPNHLILGTSCKRFAVYAIAVVALGIWFVSCARAQTPTTWIVLVTATSATSSTPSYTVTPATISSACDPADYPPTATPVKGGPQPSDGDVYVCPGDTVLWNATTGPINNNEMLLYQHDAVISAGPGFDAQNGNYVGGLVSINVKSNPYTYYVAVYDKGASRLFIDNPRIIIGTGGGPELKKAETKTADKKTDREVGEIEEKAQQLRDLVKDDPDATTEAKNQAQLIVDDIQKLKNSLHLQ